MVRNLHFTTLLCFVICASGNLVRTFVGHTDRVSKFVVQNGEMFSASDDATIMRWNLADGSQSKIYTHHVSPIRAIAIHGTTLYSTAARDLPISVDINTGSILQIFSNMLTGSGMAYNQGDLIIGTKTEIAVFDASTGSRTLTIDTEDGIRQGLFRDDEYHIFYIGGSSARSVFQYDYDTQQKVAVFTGSGTVFKLYVADKRLSVSYDDGSVKVWNFATQLLEHSFVAPSSVYGQPLHFGDSLFLSDEISGSNSILKLDLKTGRLTSRLFGHSRTVLHIERYGRWLISSSQDSTINMWDVVDCPDGFFWDMEGTVCEVSSNFTSPADSSLVLSEPLSSIVSTEDVLESSRTFFGSSSNITIPLIVVSVVILVAAVSVLVVRDRLRKAKQFRDAWGTSQYQDKSIAGRSATDLDITATIEIETRMYDDGGMQTIVPVDQGLSLPGFLMLESTAYRAEKKIGKGGTSDIYIGEGFTNELSTAGKVCIKYVHDKISMEGFKQEVAIMGSFIGVKGIVQLKGFDLESRVIVMKLCKFGNLDEWCFSSQSRKYRTKRQHFSFFLDISRALRVMHRRMLVHSDMKTPNILIDTDDFQKLYCVITDLGASQMRNEAQNAVMDFKLVKVGAMSTRFAAPETIMAFRKNSGISFEPEIDTYAYGIVLYQLLTRFRPWTI